MGANPNKIPPPGSIPAPAVVDLAPYLKKDQDNTATLTALLDSVATTEDLGALFMLPCGRWPCEGPVIVKRPGITLTGQGKGISTLVGNQWRPTIMSHPGNVVAVTATVRPDANGILDASIAPSPGVWRGLACGGRWVASGVGNVTSLGRKHPELPNGYDYYRTVDALTVEFAITTPDGKLPSAGTTVCGINGGPYTVYFDYAQRPTITAWFWGTQVTVNADSDALTKRPQPWRIGLSVSADGSGAAWEASTPLLCSAGGKPPSGAKLDPNFGEKPWLLGQDNTEVQRGAGGPQLTLWGLKVSTARKIDGGSDISRYTGLWDPACLFYLSFSGLPIQWLEVQGGPQAEHQRAVLTLVDGNKPLGGPECAGFTLGDLSIRPGNVVIGETLDLTLRNVSITAGAQPIGCSRLGAAYPLTFIDCDLDSVQDAAVSLGTGTAFFDRLKIKSFKGDTAIRARGSNLTLRDTYVKFGSYQTRTLIDSRSAPYAGQTIIDGFTYDNEDPSASVSEAVMRIESAYMNPTAVEARNAYMVIGGTEAVFLKLLNDHPQPRPCNVVASGLISGPIKAVASFSGQWTGTIDAGASATGDTMGSSSGVVVSPPHALDGMRSL